MNTAPQNPDMHHQDIQSPPLPRTTYPSGQEGVGKGKGKGKTSTGNKDKDYCTGSHGTTTNVVAEVHNTADCTRTTLDNHPSASPQASRFNDSRVVAPEDISSMQLLPSSPQHKEGSYDHILVHPDTPHPGCGQTNVLSSTSTSYRHAKTVRALDESAIIGNVSADSSEVILI
jgi:hypothetical protein